MGDAKMTNSKKPVNIKRLNGRCRFKFQQCSTVLITRIFFFLFSLLHLHDYILLYFYMYFILLRFKHSLMHRSYFLSRRPRFTRVFNKINSK